MVVLQATGADPEEGMAPAQLLEFSGRAKRSTVNLTREHLEQLVAFFDRGRDGLVSRLNKHHTYGSVGGAGKRAGGGVSAKYVGDSTVLHNQNICINRVSPLSTRHLMP